MNRSRLSIFQLTAIALAFVIFTGLVTASHAEAHGKRNPEALVFQDAMRKLWEDHVT